MANIKQITAGDTFDIEALHFKTASLDSPASWKAYIDEAIATAAKIQIVIATGTGDDNHPSVSPSADTLGKLYLVSTGSPESGTYVEWITVNTSGSTYIWEKIGTTSTDLTDYATKAQVNTSLSGTTSTGESSDTTGESGVGTITVEAAGSTIISNGTGVVAKTLNTTSAGGFTIYGSNFSFTGTAASLSSSIRINDHNYTPRGSIGGQVDISAHTHAINSTTTEVLSTITAQSTPVATAISDNGTTTAITGITTTSKTVFNSAIVTNGVLSFNSTNVLGSAGIGSSVSVWKAAKISDTADGITGFTTGTTPVVTSATVAGAGEHQIKGSNFSFTGISDQLAHEQSGSGSYRNLSVTNQLFTPSGSISGTQTVNSHTHSILPSTVTAFKVTVSLAAHTHNVTVGTHSHTIGNHTHGVSFTSIPTT